MEEKPSYKKLEKKIKQLENVLSSHKNENLAQKYFDLARVILIFLDSNGNIELINEYALELLGFPKQDIIGKNWFKTCLPERYRKDVLSVYEQLMHGEIEPVEYYENSVLSKSGKEYTIAWHNTVLKDSYGNITGTLSSGNNITDNIKNKKAFKASEEKYKNILEQIADSYLAIDLKGNFQFFNPSFCKMLGYSKKELSKKNYLDFIDKNQREKIFKIFHEIYKTGSPAVDITFEFIKKDGEKRHAEATIYLILDKNNKPSGFHGFTRDITERLAIKEKLKKSLEVTETIIENIPIGMMIVEKNKAIQRVNRAALAMTGYDSKKELIGKICHNAICPANEGACPITDLKQKIDNSEKTVIAKDGRQIPVYKTALSIELDGEDVIIEAFMDISLLKKAETELLESQEKLTAVMETIVDPVVVYDTKGRVTYLNPAFTRVFGWDLIELIGKRIDFVPDEEQQTTQEALAIVLNGEALSGTESKRTTKKGLVISVRIGAALLRDKNGKTTGIVTNFQDITREKQAQEELHKINRELEKAIKHANLMAQQAEAASQAKTQFLANMSHEIRTPLNGVIGMSNLLLDSGLTHDQKHYASIVNKSGESLLDVINDILDFAKIESGKFEIEIIDFDLRLMLDDFASIMTLRIEKKNLEFICAASPDVPSLLKGDPGRLRQILINLVGNAVKFTEKGEISVRVHLEKETSEKVWLLFSIKDTGIGIEQEKQKKLFESFTQADSSTTRKYGGTGLGLTISKQLCERMGGKIGINSKPGKGSEFWFTTCFKKQKEQAGPSIPIKKIDMKGVHVIVVDDNETNREILLEQLNRWGFRVKVTEDGHACLRELSLARGKNDPFNIGILDMQMPGMDGLSLGRAIKDDRHLKSVKLIMMTSMGQAGDAKEFQKAGFAAYLMKPVRQSDLMDCLAAVIYNDSSIADEAVPQEKQTIITRHTVREMKRRNASILLAEDNITNQQVAVGILNKIGFCNIKIVTNGAKAVEAFKSSYFDIILMDIQMPEMDGIEATRLIRKNESQTGGTRTPIIAMTAHAMKQDRDKCFNAGMDDHVTKPVEVQSLFKALEKQLSGKEDKEGFQDSESSLRSDLKTIKNENQKIFSKDILMERLMGDEQLFETVIKSFLDDIPKQIKALEKFIDTKNITDAGKQGHQIKGAAANVGADELKETAYKIETAGKTEDLQTVVSLLPQLKKSFDKVRQKMEEFIS